MHEPSRILYVLFRYPQLSQTFVRDEIAAVRRTGANVTVLSLDDPGLDAPSSSWSGDSTVVARPPTKQAIRDLGWWATRRPRAVGRLLGLAVAEPGRRRYILARVPSAARRLSEEGIDHVHCHFAWETSTVASALADLLCTPATITVHAKDIYAQPVRSVRRRLARFSMIVTVCHYNVGFLIGKGLVTEGAPPIRVIACGVGAPPAGPGPDAQATTDVVAVGRLVEKKGFDILLRALARPEADASWGSAVIVGGGPERAKLEALRDDLGLAERVTFTGPLQHREALEQIASARIFCLPARRATDNDSDAMPVVIREAMVRGVPVVATRIAGIPESVDHEVGWVVEPSDVASLSAAIGSALTDETERRRRGRQAQARAATAWTFEQQADELRSVFTGALASSCSTTQLPRETST